MEDVIKHRKIHGIIKNNKIDLSSINSDGVKVILKELLNGEFDKEAFSSFMKEANITLQTVTVGIGEFLKQTGHSSKEYTDTLSKIVEELMVKVDRAQSIEEEERLWNRIEGVLDRMKKEADEGRRNFNTIGPAAAITGVAILGLRQSLQP